MNKLNEKVTTLYHDWQFIVAVLMGAILQALLANKKSYKAVALIFFSAIFMALYVVKPFIAYINLSNENIIVALYALSSLLSMELLSLLITILPKGFRHKLIKILDLEDTKNDNREE